MDELRMIRETLASRPPSASATSHARNRLTAAIAEQESPAAPRQRRWSMRRALGGAVAVAGAAAVAVVVATTMTPATQAGHPAGPAAVADGPGPASAHTILLAAAGTAGSAEIGKYWRVQSVGDTGPFRVGTAPHQYDLVDRAVTEDWIAPDPRNTSYEGRRDLGHRPRTETDVQAWQQAGSPRQWEMPGNRRLTMAPGKATLKTIENSDFLLDLGGFTSAQVEQLPTDPAQLRTMLADRIAAGKDGVPAGTPGSDQRMFGTLIQLLVYVPAPPKVRAAAFGALADLPGMHTTGMVKDSEGRAGIGIGSSVTTTGMQTDAQLILDPSTHQILSFDTSARTTGPDGRPVKEGTLVILKAEWTDETPTAPTIS